MFPTVTDSWRQEERICAIFQEVQSHFEGVFQGHKSVSEHRVFSSLHSLLFIHFSSFTFLPGWFPRVHAATC